MNSGKELKILPCRLWASCDRRWWTCIWWRIMWNTQSTRSARRWQKRNRRKEKHNSTRTGRSGVVWFLWEEEGRFSSKITAQFCRSLKRRGPLWSTEFCFRLDLVRESHAVSLAQLATEQDRLYQQLEELRSVNDVIEEVLDKANPYQIQSAYGVRNLRETFAIPFLTSTQLHLLLTTSRSQFVLCMFLFW